MARNFRRRYITDFGRVEGVPGVYMANQLGPDVMGDPGSRKTIDYEKFIQSKVRGARTRVKAWNRLPCGC
jgi:hypothetical protein